MTSYEQFTTTRRFDQIDGLRALSILLVIAFHSHDPLWFSLRGYLGVTVFFVVSGFIITTLLLREESKNSQVSKSKFYVRRAFRIFPLYYLALAAFAFLTLVLHLGNDPESFADRLPYYLLYMNEFAGPGTFTHSWSLGVEEKFYLIWPALAFSTLAVVRRGRVVLAAGLLVLSVIAGSFDAVQYFAIYAPILGGCLLALLLDNPRTFTIVRKMANPAVAVVCVALMIVVGLLDRSSTYVHSLFAIATLLAFPALVLNPTAIYLLSARPLVYVGLRSYALYLFHPIVASGVDIAVAPGRSVAEQVIRLFLIIGISLGVAAVLFRWFEQPLIRLGRRMTTPRLPLAEGGRDLQR